MKIAISSDEQNHLTTAIIEYVQAAGHEVSLFGALRADDPEKDWPLCSSNAAREVVEGRADEAIVLCWTGTGVSIAANKLPGIRAALCVDAETARGARIWNNANVLALSIRLTSEAVAKEILKMWFQTAYEGDAWNSQQMERLARLDQR